MRTLPSLVLPMPLDGNKLTAEQIAAFKTWIEEGAHWDATESNAGPPSPRAAVSDAKADW